MLLSRRSRDAGNACILRLVETGWMRWIQPLERAICHRKRTVLRFFSLLSRLTKDQALLPSIAARSHNCQKSAHTESRKGSWPTLVNRVRKARER